MDNSPPDNFPRTITPGQFPLPFWVGHFPRTIPPPICYAYIHTHVCIHTHTHTYTHTHIHIHTYIHTYIYIHTYTYIYMHVCMYVCMGELSGGELSRGELSYTHPEGFCPCWCSSPFPSLSILPCLPFTLLHLPFDFNRVSSLRPTYLPPFRRPYIHIQAYIHIHLYICVRVYYVCMHVCIHICIIMPKYVNIYDCI